jgi:U4/U6.U5 tri-snRNP-associated protein 1
LDKYDEEIDGEKKRSFRLGTNGVYDGGADKFIEEQNNLLKSKEIKLDIGAFKIATDYLTKEEQVCNLSEYKHFS